jgi:hypothetical protein
MRARALAVLYGVLLVGFLAQEAVAQNLLMRRQCHTDFQGQVWRGVMQIERLLYYDTNRIYGQFRDSYGNLAECEVLTSQPGGVGGLWLNHAKHRETRIHLQLLNDGFVVTAEGGAAARYFCK